MQNMQKVTIDIRDRFGDGFAESNLQRLIDEERQYGREVTEVYCTEAQKKTIEGFVTKDKDAKGKTKEVKTFDGVNLTVA